MTRTVIRGALRAVAVVGVLLAALVAVGGVGAAGARADGPVALPSDGQVLDRVGALRARRPEVADALDRLAVARGIRLFVVYVRDFSGRSARAWADATAERNGLGHDDVLLAVATHDRRYGWAAAPGGPLTRESLDEVARTAVEPALRHHDWAGAAIGAAGGCGAVLAGRPVPVPEITPGPVDPGGPRASSASDLVLPVAVVGGAVAIGAYSWSRRRRRAATRTTPGGDGPGRVRPGADPEER
ncbi:TPM domain-containing protein [Streptomyces termitum]|uniref:TPM domain-containing protein n=1 Tax=Streptomyces termitum TaxID=67368 RepID=UPI003F4BBB8C